ncbi:hypothetical protein BGS_1254 [Beggiatoa sp. SS]|nr:hypothetical protein BGS_1254 [Beggiatoa sp. SS]
MLIVCGVPPPPGVSVGGEKRLGKTSLLYRFSQTWAERVGKP